MILCILQEDTTWYCTTVGDDTEAQKIADEKGGEAWLFHSAWDLGDLEPEQLVSLYNHLRPGKADIEEFPEDEDGKEKVWVLMTGSKGGKKAPAKKDSKPAAVEPPEEAAEPVKAKPGKKAAKSAPEPKKGAAPKKEAVADQKAAPKKSEAKKPAAPKVEVKKAAPLPAKGKVVAAPKSRDDDDASTTRHRGWPKEKPYERGDRPWTSDDQKITVLRTDSPYLPGSRREERHKAILACKGKPVRDAVKAVGLPPVRRAVDFGIIKVG